MDKTQIIRDMFDAIENNNSDEVLEILSKAPEVLHIITPFGTWLHFASSEGKIKIVKLLINLGLDVNKKSGAFNGNGLNEAANEGHYDIVEYLLTCGAELDVDEPERNPLFGAILSGNKDIVQLLLDSGIDYTVRYTGEYMKDMDAYDFAVERGQLEIAELIKNYKRN